MKDKTEDERFRQQAAAMNQELMLSAVRQHELMEAVEKLNAELQAEIVERKRAEEELGKYRDSLENLVEERTADLRESEERFRLMVSVVKDYAIFMLSPTGEIITWNEGAQSLTGYAPSEAIGRHFSTYFYEEELIAGKPTVELEYAASKGSFEDEGLRVRKDGSTFWANVVITALRDPDGKLRGYSKVVRDITERKRAEEDLRASETKYRQLFENMRDGFAHCKMLFDDQGRPADFVYLDVNSVFEKLTGLKDVVGKKVTEVIPGIRESSPDFFEIYGRVALTGNSEKFEMELKPLGIWFSISAYSTAREYFVAIFDNITERKRAEIEREVTVEFLRIVNESAGTDGLVRAAATFFQERSGCEAVGIRLHERGDYPYSEARGFPNEFVEMETSLCTRDAKGEVERDELGNPVLACMCGNVVCGRFDVSKPFFTEHGSFWTNNTTQLLASTTDADRQVRTRNRCNGEGYESVALIPLCIGQERLGLLQLNDRREGMFTLDAINMWERLTGYLAVALSKFLAEEKLKESEAQFRTFADAIPTLCWMANGDGWIFWYNSRWYEYTGTTPEQMEGWGWQSVHDPEALPEVMERWTGSVATGQPFEMTFPLRGADGVFRTFLTRAIPVRDTDGKVVRWFGANYDITEQKRFEEDLEKLVSERTAELYRLNSYNRRLLEASLDPLVTIGPDGKITDVNAASEKITGLSRDELIGTDFSDYFTEPEKARAGYQQVFRDGVVRDYPLEVRHSDGHTTSVLYNASVYKDEEGKVVGVFAAARDITERKRMEEEALGTQKLDSLRVLAGGVAHDLNNLMVAITLNAGLALHALPEGTPAREFIDNIEAATEKVTNFSKQILSFTSKAAVKREPVQLNKVVEETARLLMASVSKKADLSYSLADDLPSIIGDPQNMQQIVMNLIINASDALGSDRGTIKVSTGRISAGRSLLDRLQPAGLPEGDYVYVEVADTGCGMSMETRGRIFEPFYTTKFTGRGLGLSAVFGIVSAHGGAIGIESEEGCGATLRVLLPIPAKPVAPAAKKLVAEDLWSGKGTILVADDEKSALLMAKKVLESAGYKVLTAEDGSEAVEIFRQNANSISAVLMDLIMPHMRGDEAAKEMRKIKGDINILLMSGYHELDLTELTTGPGRTSILGKPYRVTELLDAVLDILKV